MSDNDWALIASAAFSEFPKVLAAIGRLEDSLSQDPARTQYEADAVKRAYQGYASVAWRPFWNALGGRLLDDLPSEPVVDSAVTARNSVRVLMDYLRTKVASVPSAPVAQDDPIYTLDEEDLAILRVLFEFEGRRLTVSQIANHTRPRVGDRTVATRLKQMIDAGLAARPKGGKQGATITPAGNALLAKAETSSAAV
jgi:hypothetical protein